MGQAKPRLTNRILETLAEIGSYIEADGGETYLAKDGETWDADDDASWNDVQAALKWVRDMRKHRTTKSRRRLKNPS